MVEEAISDLKNLFRQAADIAAQVPESMQEAAFNRALDLLVGGVEHDIPKREQERNSTGASTRSQDKDLLQEIDSTKYPQVMHASRALDRSLMVLQIAHSAHSVDGLTAAQIARILTEKFRLRTTRQAVGMALKDAADLVDRVSEGRTYRYRIMGPGESYVTQLAERGPAEDSGKKVSTTRKRSPGKTRSSASRRNSVVSGKTVKSAKTESKKAGGKHGSTTALSPKRAVTELIESGFFDTPKTGLEVQEHLKKKRGYDLGPDQLRMAMLRLVREGALERDENDSRQYEYKRP